MIGLEETVIGAVLLDERFLPDAMRSVSPDDFHDRRLGAIFACILAMRERGEPVDVITVSARLDEIEARGIEPVDLHMWAGEVPSAASVAFYAGEVRTQAVTRGVAQIAVRMREAADDPGKAIRLGLDELKALQARQATTKGRSFRVSELLALPTEHDWVVEGFIERRDRFMLTGYEGLGKSAMLRQFVFAAAAGMHPFRDYQQAEPRRTLVVDAENSPRQWARNMRQLVSRVGHNADERLVEENITIHPTTRLDLLEPGDRAELHRLIDDTRPDLMMIGPLYRLTRGSVNGDDEAAPLLAALDEFRDRGLALLIEAHAGKADDGKGNRNLSPRGSSALIGWPEFGMGLRPVPNTSGQQAELVRWRGDREERSWPRRLVKAQNGLPWQILEGQHP